MVKFTLKMESKFFVNFFKFETRSFLTIIVFTNEIFLYWLFDAKQQLTFQIRFGWRNGSLSGSELYDATVRIFLYATTVTAVVAVVVVVDATRDRWCKQQNLNLYVEGDGQNCRKKYWICIHLSFCRWIGSLSLKPSSH